MDIRRKHKWLLLISICLMIHSSIDGQIVQQETESYTDSVASPNYMPTYETLLNEYISNSPTWKKTDTTYLLFADFDPAFNSRFYSASLGNIGHSHRLLDYEMEPFGFKMKKIPLPNYLYSHSNLPYFKSSSPYTRVFYVAGSNKHHYLNGVHAQTINNISLGTTFNVINSLGAYQQQRTSVAGASAYINYSNRKENYKILFSYFFNQINNRENGGIANDSLFTNNIESFRGGMPISMQKARNEYVHNRFQITQNYLPFLKKDSIKQSKNQWLILSHTFKYDKQKWMFSQDELDSIQSISARINPAYTKDSLAGHHFENRLEWQTNLHFPIGKWKVQFNSAFGINHSMFSVGDSIQKEKNDYYGMHARASIGSDSIWKIYYCGEQIVGGWNAGAFSQNINFTMLAFRKHEIQFDLQLRSNPQYYFYNNFNGNFHHWKKESPRVNEKKFGVAYSYLPISLGFDLFQISNIAYISSEQKAEIFTNNIEMARFWSEINLKYRILHSQTKFSFHQNSANEIMMFPDYVVRQKVFTVFHIFHKAMLASTGIEGVYIPEYYGAFYSPNLFDFYVNKTQSIGNFFYLDLFIGFKVKRFNFMAKMLNAPQGLLPYDYFSTPHYPLPDRQFRIGVSWRFYD